MGKNLHPKLAKFLIQPFQKFVFIVCYFRLCIFRDNDSLPEALNPLSANPTKWSNTLNQFVG